MKIHLGEFAVNLSFFLWPKLNYLGCTIGPESFFFDSAPLYECARVNPWGGVLHKKHLLQQIIKATVKEVLSSTSAYFVPEQKHALRMLNTIHATYLLLVCNNCVTSQRFLHESGLVKAQVAAGYSPGCPACLPLVSGYHSKIIGYSQPPSEKPILSLAEQALPIIKHLLSHSSGVFEENVEALVDEKTNKEAREMVNFFLALWKRELKTSPSPRL